jgi:hypothetical protein
MNLRALLLNFFLVALFLFDEAPNLICQSSPQEPSASSPLSYVSSLPLTSEGRARWCTPEPRDMFASELKWTIPFKFQGSTDWIRLHLRLEGKSPQSDWWVEISQSQVAERPEHLQPSDLAQPGGRWSSRIYGDSAEVRVYDKAALNSLSICIDAYSYAVPTAVIEPKLLVDGQNDHRKDLSRADSQYKFGLPVALVYFQKSGAGQDFSCSGFAITSTLLVTNNHCISAAEQIPTAGVWYNYDVDNDQQPADARFDELIATDSVLDYTIVRLAAPLDSKYIARVSRSPLASPLPPVMQIQHPAGGRKKIAVPCSIEDIDASDIGDGVSDFYHLCDASDGSSGSPIMIEESGVVVGLHNGGSSDKKTWNNHNSALKIDRMLRSIEEKLKSSKDRGKISALNEIRAIK